MREIEALAALFGYSQAWQRVWDQLQTRRMRCRGESLPFSADRARRLLGTTTQLVEHGRVSAAGVRLTLDWIATAPDRLDGSDD